MVCLGGLVYLMFVFLVFFGFMFFFLSMFVILVIFVGGYEVISGLGGVLFMFGRRES